MLKKTLVASLSLAAITTYAAASQSLLETYEQAVANDPSLAIAKLNAESSAQDVINGFSNVIPSVGLTARYGISGEPGAAESVALNFDSQYLRTNLNVSQTFALAAFTAYDSVKAFASVEQMKVTQAESDLMVTVAEKYLNALRAKEALGVLKAQLEAVERQFEQTEQRYDVGLVTVTDVLDAEATLDQTKVSLIRAESQYDIALQDLFTVTGSVPEGVLTISEEVPIVAPAADAQQEWVDYAVANHPDVLIAEQGLKAGQLAFDAERQNLLPSARASFDVTHMDVFDVNNDSERNWSASLAVDFSVDLYTGGKNSSAIAKRGISNNITEQNIEMLKRGKAVQVANLYRTVRADAQNIAAQEQALESRESALQATTVGYEVGTRNIVEVLNAQLAAFSAENALNNARYDYLLNLLKLKQQAGQLKLADLQSIEDYLVE